MKTYDETVKTLEEKIPRDCVSTRPGGRSTLSYLEGWYVTNRLNKIFGNLKWSYDIERLDKVFEGTIKDRYDKDVFTVSYTARVRLTVPSFKDTPKGDEALYYGSGAVYEDVGFGNGTDKKDPGKAHELATKEAITDALKRCARNLGMSMGLALYDKTQENVDDETTETTTKSKTVPAPTVPKGNKSKGTGDLKATVGLVNSTFRAAKAKRVTDEEAVKTYLQDKFKVNKVAELNATQATKFLTHLQSLIA